MDNSIDNLKEEYDFSQMSGDIRGKYVTPYREGTNLILLEPDVAKVFPDAQSVNEALRALVKIIQQHRSYPSS